MTDHDPLCGLPEFVRENAPGCRCLLIEAVAIRTRADERQKVVEDLTEAIRFTVEYVGLETLPPIEGWSWYDALVKYAPEKAAILKGYWVRFGYGDG